MGLLQTWVLELIWRGKINCWARSRCVGGAKYHLMWGRKHHILPHIDVNVAWEHGGYGLKVYVRVAFHPPKKSQFF